MIESQNNDYQSSLDRFDDMMEGEIDGNGGDKEEGEGTTDAGESTE